MSPIMQFSQQSSLINSSAIRKIFDLAAQKKDPINLSIGQPDFPVPAEIKEAINKALIDNQTQYTQTQGLFSFREQLAQKFREENSLLGFHGHPASADNILVSSGVSAILFLLFAIYLDPGDEIILTDPYFLIYDALASYFRAKVLYVREDHLLEDLEQTLNDKTKFFIFSSPSNPTGRILDQETLKALADLLSRYNTLAIADEIYEKFDFDNRHFSLGSIYHETITLNGFSKAYAMTGLRLGYVYAPVEVINRMSTIQQYTFVCAPHPVQAAGQVALACDLSSFVADYRLRRDLIFDALKDSFLVSKPDGAFYIYPKLPPGSRVSAQQFAELAIENNVLVVPGNIFSRQNDGFRISFATSEQKLKQGAEILVGLMRNQLV